MSRFSDMMTDAMTAQNVSATEMAKQLGCSIALVSQYRNGHHMPGIKRLNQICQILGIDYNGEPCRSQITRLSVRKASKALNITPASLRSAIDQDTWDWAKSWKIGDKTKYWIDKDRFEEEMGVRVS